MYFILPETEGYTLEEIELHFQDNSKKLTDRKILKLDQNTYEPNMENGKPGVVNEGFQIDSTKF